MLKKLSEDTKDYWTSGVIALENPNPVDFMREVITAYRPAIIRGVIDHWPALDWTLEKLSTHFAGTSVNINVTPDGLGDCVKNINGRNVFVYPADVTMDWSVFADMMSCRYPDDAVPYLSQQDDNIRKHFPSLLNEIDSSLSLAQVSFGVDNPEAINLWIGDERSVSSLHQDFFENFYAVVSGEKTFTLLPPTDIAFLPEVECETMRYDCSCMNEKLSNTHNHISKNQLTLVPAATMSSTSSLELQSDVTSDTVPSSGNTSTLPWIDLDPNDDFMSNVSKYPLYQLASPIHCTVKAGEVLYLPAMWYHRVSQTCLTISVNYWYEQRFDFRYVYLTDYAVEFGGRGFQSHTHLILFPLTFFSTQNVCTYICGCNSLL
jgi:peptidyl-lysine (3S)-dioxygenase / protease